MRITLNSSIPEELRAKAEALFRLHDPGAEILWADSRFPKLVILAEPSERSEDPEGPIFDSLERSAILLVSATARIEEELRERCWRNTGRKPAWSPD